MLIKSKSLELERNYWWAGIWGCNRDLTEMSMRGHFGVMETPQSWIVVMVTQIWKFTKNRLLSKKRTFYWLNLSYAIHSSIRLNKKRTKWIMVQRFSILAHTFICPLSIICRIKDKKSFFMFSWKINWR